MLEFLKDHKDEISAIQSIVAIIAIAIGAIWTYLIFVRKRLRFPKATIEHNIETLLIRDNIVVIRNHISIINIGETRIVFEKGFTRIQAIDPYQKNGESNESILKREEKSTGIGWPMLEEVPFNNICLELEPGESDTIVCDHILSADLSTISIYTHINNRKKNRLFFIFKPQEMGWNLTTTYKVS